MGIVWSALWRHTYRWWEGTVLGGLLGASACAGWLGGPVWVGVGFLALYGVLLGPSYLRWRARRRGFRVLYVVPAPRWWVARRLRTLGYLGPVASRIWEMHVNEGRRWTAVGDDPIAAVRRFRQAYTADRMRWLAERPPGVGLLICTFNRLPPAEWAALEAAGAWATAGPLHPAIPAAVDAQRQQKVQTRMFGAVVSTHDRSNGAEWVTVYVPPRGRGEALSKGETETG